MRVLLVGNYEPDRQESMSRFCQILEQGLSEQGIDVRVTRPGVFFTRWFPERSPLRKWFGYLDKLVLFPWRLRQQALWADIDKRAPAEGPERGMFAALRQMFGIDQAPPP